MKLELLEKLMARKENRGERAKREQYGLAAALVGMGCNVLLFAAKLTAGLLSGSIAVLADAFNNLSDAGSSVVSFVGFRMAAKPADKEHPFGHGRVEYISGLIVSFLILFVGLQLFLSSVEKIFSEEEMTRGWLTPLFLVISILVKLWMGRFYRSVGQKIDSSALKASAQDSLNDVIATAAVLLSFVVFLLTGVSLDGIFGLGVAVFIFISGIKMAGETASPLLGQAPDPALVEAIESVVLAHDGITGVHDVVVHNYGPGRSIITAHAEVPVHADMQQCHELIDRIERSLTEEFRLEAAVLHMDPIATDDDYTGEVRGLLLEQLNGIDPRLTMHDFRLVRGTEKIDLIFDVVIPMQFDYTAELFLEELNRRMKKVNPDFCLRVQIDRSFD